MSFHSTTFSTDTTFTAPATLIHGNVFFSASGSVGGSSGSTGLPGQAAICSGNVATSPGDVFDLYVGDYHLGGSGGTGGPSDVHPGHPGGGSSAVVKGSLVLCEAGGGGGAGGIASSGGDGGSGGNPGAGGAGYPGSGGGGGANGSSPGAGGTGSGGTGYAAGSAGSAGGSIGSTNGGAGASTGTATLEEGGGGGGGGVAGGGGGSAGIGVGNVGGGGGGSSAITTDPSVSGGSIINGGNGGAAYISLAYYIQDPPNAPELVSPAPSAILDANGAGVTFQGTYEQGTDCGTLLAVALSLQEDGGTTHYWNGTDFSSTTPVWVTPTSGLGAATGDPFTVAVPAGVLADGHTYTWSLACQESGEDLDGDFATAQSFMGVVPPTATITAPIGDIDSLTPTVTWTNTTPAGAQTNYRFVIYDAAKDTSTIPTSFDASAVYDSTSLSGMSLSLPIPSGVLDNLETYYGYLQIVETGSISSLWYETTFSTMLDGPATPVLTAFPSTDTVTGMPAPLLAAVMNDNLMSAGASSFEAPFSTIDTSNCTAIPDTTWASDGIFSLDVTSTGSSPMYVDLEDIVATPGATVWLQAVVHASATPRTASLRVEWYDVAVFLSESVIASATDSTATPGVLLSGSVTVPPSATKGRVRVEWASAVADEKHQVDEVGWFLSEPAAWSIGGFWGNISSEYQADYVGDGSWQDILDDLVAVVDNPTDQTSTCFDRGAPFNIPISYRVRSTATIGGQPYASAWSNTVQIDGVLSTNWWIVPPTDLDSSLMLHRLPSSATSAMPSGLSASIVIDEPEQQGIFRPFGKSTATIIHGDMWAEEFDLDLYFIDPTEWASFKAIRELQKVVLLKSDMEGTTYWVTLGSARPAGIASRSGRQVSPTRGLTIHCTPTDAYVPA